MLFNIRMDKKDIDILKKLAASYGYSMSDYVKRKVFDENEDLKNGDIRYIIPHANKHKLLIVSLLHKILYMLKKTLLTQGITADEIQTSENESLFYAKEKLEKHGYKIFKNLNE
jgi:hypothetical protein